MFKSRLPDVKKRFINRVVDYWYNHDIEVFFALFFISALIYFIWGF